MDETLLERLIHEQLNGFEQNNPSGAEHIREAMEVWDRQKGEVSFLAWWKAQDTSWIAALHSYVFWLWREGKIEHGQFETVYTTTAPVLSKSWSMPIVITTGVDDPIFEDGFVERKFSVFQYQFSPSNRALLVTCQELPSTSETHPGGLDSVLDFLSFVLDKSGSGYLGFRQIASRKTHSSETAIVGVGLGPEIQSLPDFDFERIEGALRRIGLQREDAGLSLAELLHVRHRAILDSNLESELIALWSSIEAQWGEEDKQDRLLSPEEYKRVKKALDFLPQGKYSRIIDQISKLKNKTRNDKIIKGISNLQCAREWDVKRTVRDIHALRSRFAHGNIMSPDDQARTERYVSTMLQIIDELITQKLAKYNIVFS